MINLTLTPKEIHIIRRVLGNIKPSALEAMKISDIMSWHLFDKLNTELRMQGHYPDEMDGHYIDE